MEDGFGNSIADSESVPDSQQAWTSDRLIPVVAHLCQQSELQSHDAVAIRSQPVSQLRLVGRVQDVVRVSMFTMLEIADHTGVITCRSWKPVQATPASHVTLVGRIVGNEDTRIFDIHHLSPVTDFNQITYHLLDTLVVWKALISGKTLGYETETTTLCHTFYAPHVLHDVGESSRSLATTNNGTTYSRANAASSCRGDSALTLGPGSDAASSLPFLHRGIVQFLAAAQCAQDTAAIVKHFTGTALEEEVTAALAYLLESGLVYQTGADAFATSSNTSAP